MFALKELVDFPLGGRPPVYGIGVGGFGFLDKSAGLGYSPLWPGLVWDGHFFADSGDTLLFDGPL